MQTSLITSFLELRLVEKSSLCPELCKKTGLFHYLENKVQTQAAMAFKLRARLPKILSSLRCFIASASL